MIHLRFAGLGFDRQATALTSIIEADPVLWTVLERARDLDLPDWMVVSGAVYNTVWNQLSERPAGYGIRDIDLFYFDGADRSFEAEDAVIQECAPHFARTAFPIEIRNQARVHLWYRDKFGGVCPAYRTSAHALAFFAAKTHAVGVRLERSGELSITAPFGLDPIFAFRMVPNRALDNRATYEAKSARAAQFWPEITVDPW